MKEIKKEIKITDNLKNEDQKDYPAIGSYTINIKYQDQKLKKKVIQQLPIRQPTLHKLQNIMLL